MVNRIFEQQGRAACQQDAVTDFSHFEVCRYGRLDALELASAFKLSYKVSQITIFHNGLVVSVAFNNKFQQIWRRSRLTSGNAIL